MGGRAVPPAPITSDNPVDASRPRYDNTASQPADPKTGDAVASVVAAKPEKKIYSINWKVLQSKGMLVPEMARSQMAEEYRLIKRPLLMNAFPDGSNGIERANLILVTSSVPGEGKTFTAVNLALSIAMERDRTVLLVDADVAKPSISRLLGIREQAGLIDLLERPDVKVSDVLLKTDIPNLSLLPAGRLHQHSTELLASQAMKKLARELSERYPDRIVIFDSPPLLAATQGSVLANLVGQVVLVVESDVTPQYIVKESASKLEACKVVGCILNKTKKGFGFTYYGYGYGYGYGYYGQQKNEEA
ncbi:tyrosine-protein kinase family protein [Methylococcus sp. EFPC2]|nr:tyrosine-protein kinase family protein [Methylococcus sp. EFPC2]